MFTLFTALLWLVVAGAREPDRGLEEVEPQVIRANRVALVIGNSAYEHTTPLANPRHDAEDLTVVLDTLGFTVIEGLDLGHSAMIRKLREFAVAVRGAEVGLVFYAGHGLQVDGTNYMVPIDAKLASAEALDFEAVPMDRVVQELEREPRMSMLVLDACRNNPLVGELSRAFGTTSRSKPNEGLAVINATAPETLVVFSTQPGAVAADGTGRNSPFTKALVQHLPTPGLDVEAAIKLVTRDVIQASAGAQVPFRSSSLTREYVFRAGSGSAAAVEQVTLAPGTTEPAPLSLEEQVAKLQDQQQSRVETERRLEQERQDRIDAASAPIQDEARRVWREISKLTKTGGPEAEVALLKFVEQYQGATVQVDGEILDVRIPEVDEARGVLASLGQDRTVALEAAKEGRRKKRVQFATGAAIASLVLWSGAATTARSYNNPAPGDPVEDDALFLANRVLFWGAVASTATTGGLYLSVAF